MFRSLVNWLKRTVINTAFKELSAELEAGGAVATDPPMLTLEVEPTPAIADKPRGRKAAKK